MPNGNDRGSSQDRARRKGWLLKEFGVDGIVVSYRCNVPMLPEDITVDRIIPGALGGRYTRKNIRPACGPCNFSTGTEVKRKKSLEQVATTGKVPVR